MPQGRRNQNRQRNPNPNNEIAIARQNQIEDLRHEFAVYDMHLDQLSQSWKESFQKLFCVVFVILICLVYAQFTIPWELKFYAYFEEQIEAGIMMVITGVAAFACLVALYALSCHYEQKMRVLIMASLLGTCVAAFWLYYMMGKPKFQWYLMWLPMTPLWCFLVCLYVEHLLTESQAAIDKLQISICNA